MTKFVLDPWIKLNKDLVCFGAKGNQFGNFSFPSSVRLLVIKLVHLHGYVTCNTKKPGLVLLELRYYT